MQCWNCGATRPETGVRGEHDGFFVPDQVATGITEIGPGDLEDYLNEMVAAGTVNRAERCPSCQFIQRAGQPQGMNNPNRPDQQRLTGSGAAQKTGSAR